MPGSVASGTHCILKFNNFLKEVKRLYCIQFISKDKPTFNYITDILFLYAFPKVHSSIESFENLG